MLPLPHLAILLSGYLLGSIPTGWLVGHWLAGIDVRQVGSGSTGATNVLRVVGRGPALVVFLVDVGKGTLAVSLAIVLLEGHGGLGSWQTDAWMVAAGLAALTGHSWPIWLKGKGGKAVATSLGMLLGLAWPVALACLGIFALILSLTRIVSLGSVVAALALPPLMLAWFGKGDLRLPYLALALLCSILVVWRHRANLQRLMAGTEPRIGQETPSPPSP